MPALPIISGAKAVKAFRKAHWVEVRRRGSHIILVKEGSQVTLSVPNHKELDRGTLRGLIRTAGISVEQFCNLLD
ncbi:MAG TPA: type II toxin-antitoxin system HicA family toxin [Firmicutes bacterium]|nr:type II toxin-antitoxin system HicA family toxin [Bacillota bacterium]